MTASVIPSPRPVPGPAPADPPPFLRSLAELDAELADNTVRVRRLLDQLVGTRRALAVVETRRRRLLEARARTAAVVALEQLLEPTG